MQQNINGVVVLCEHDAARTFNISRGTVEELRKQGKLKSQGKRPCCQTPTAEVDVYAFGKWGHSYRLDDLTSFLIFGERQRRKQRNRKKGTRKKANRKSLASVRTVRVIKASTFIAVLS